MGIGYLPSKLKKCAGKKCKVDAITLASEGKRCVVGIDISCTIMASVRTNTGAEEYHSSPPLPHRHVARAVLDKVRKYQKENIEVIPVFDGISRTPLKQDSAGVGRDDTREAALQMLKKLLKTPWPADEKKQKDILTTIAAKRKASAKANENTIAEVMQILEDNDIKYVVAPFEADWQLAYMHSQGIIDAIETTDSDLWALLDHPCCLMEVNSTDLRGYLCYSEGCSLLGSNDSMQQSGRLLDKPIYHVTRFGAILRATVYGNDYHNGVKGLGETTLERLITNYKDDENGLIQHLTNTYSSFEEKYKRMNGIYRNTPVFEMTHNTTSSSSAVNFSFTGNIVSHEGNDVESWNEIVGFDPHTLIYQNFESELPSYKSIAEGKWLAAYGKATESCLVMRAKNGDGKEIPYGSDLNFVDCPPCYQPIPYLVRWLNVRGHRWLPRHDLLESVQKLRSQKEPATVMTEEEAQILLPKSLRYSGLKILLPSSTKCVWERNDLRILRKVKGGGKYIYQIFGKRNGVRRRALNRLRNGHFYIDTLKTAKVRSKAKYGKQPNDLYIIQCQCLASMRSNVYNVNLVVNNKGDFIKSPFSRCSCAAGNMFCAHMLGLNIKLCQLAKKNPTWDRVTMQARMPSHVEQVQRLCIPIIGMWNEKLNSR